MDLDATDRALIEALQGDARASIPALAADVGIGADAVERRLAALEDAGVVTGYTADVDYDRLGYDVTGLVRLRVDGAPEVAARALATYPWARAVYEVTGEDDFLVIGTFRDTDAMHTRVAELLGEQTVHSITVDVVLNVVREFEPLPVPAADS